MNVDVITLEGKAVRLEPLEVGHVPDLLIAGADETIWRYLPYGFIMDEPKMVRYVRWLLSRAESGIDLPFAVIFKKTGCAIGVTRYIDISIVHRNLEIGGTWYAVAYQRTIVNTEAKFLLLLHAFEELGCIRVQFKTDARNIRSQKALERIGAVREGILRNHMILPDGHLRNSIFYSIIKSEWPKVKINLKEKLGEDQRR